MLILKKLYSNSNLFKEVIFQKGINIILGVYTKKDPRTISELNGIGKSTLVRLIDFVLLSDTARTKYFDVPTHKFLKGHSVTLVFEVDSIDYYIERNFETPKEIRFGKNLDSLETYDETELRRILGAIFFGRGDYDGEYDNSWFRSLIKFFIKDDVNHHERKDPLKFISEHKGIFETYMYNLFLMNLPNRELAKYDELQKSVDALREQKRKLLERLKEDTGKKIEEINSEVRIIDDKINSFQKSIDDFKFLESYVDVEKKIIDISSDVSSFLSKLNMTEKKLDEYRRSYLIEIEIDKNKVVSMYGQVKKVFGEIIEKELEEVISFRKNLLLNRKKFLAEKEIEMNNEIKDITEKISSLEDKRSALYKILNEKKAFDSIKNTYTQLIQEKTRKERLVTSIADISKLEDAIIKKNVEVTQTIEKLSEETAKTRVQIDAIATLFLEIVKDAIKIGNPSEAVFDIRSASDMNSPLKISVDVPKSDALGKSRFKILAYDLTVFLNSIKNNYALPGFLIHDGVFHGIDVKTFVRVMNYINSQFLKNNKFQYIITANEDEIYIPDDKKEVYGTYNFDIDRNVVATYKDSSEDMIFRQEY